MIQQQKPCHGQIQQGLKMLFQMSQCLIVVSRVACCFRLTRSTEDKGEKVQAIITITTAPLRVSVLFILRVSPKARASAFKSFHLLLSLNTEYGGKEKKCKQ